MKLLTTVLTTLLLTSAVGHAAEEAMCMEGDMKCAAEKAKHRVQEGKDTATDKMKDMKDEMSK